MSPKMTSPLKMRTPLLRFVPVKAQVHGGKRGSESAAFIPTLEAAVMAVRNPA